MGIKSKSAMTYSAKARLNRLQCLTALFGNLSWNGRRGFVIARDAAGPGAEPPVDFPMPARGPEVQL
ncbi:hypothetical protein CH63R_02635 [Colletotrichum higginsianum IMI 349063]|uniref:Uncharacterized protein n=1 Tax=Colletotrichum higginsianum (strain IMI 349063) TaxID=759273 RepID=A0A1B7YPH6_COLHI|nr:hypothetical protein CH63R_02635 [Colletotrichum higginsianum IMI 349063]OBR13909.1 hypothetical protein CH63R_02635 [Colletotrichum higginsianum IMI 349063]